MHPYHKIDSVFKRDMTSPAKTLIVGDYTNAVFEYLANNNWVFTEKVDGTNIRVIIADGAITFGGKSDNAQIPAPLVQRLQERFLAQKNILLDAFPEGATLYGEGYGPKIQKGGGNYRNDQDFVLFDVKVGDWWLQRSDVELIAEQRDLDVVPVIGEGTLADAVALVTTGFNSTWGPFQAEGLVARPKVELKQRDGSRVITKLKHRDFQPASDGLAA